MKKYSQIIQKETVDTTTGEIITCESEKVFTKQINSDSFYMTFIDYIAPLFNLKSDAAKNLLNWLCCNAEYNTGKVLLTTSIREKLCKDLGVKNNSITNNLKKLKDLNLISGEKGNFMINPSIFWKGDTNTRNKLLEDNKIKITFKIGL